MYGAIGRSRGKTDGAWNGPDMETPVGATSIYGAMAGESPMAACNRLGMDTWMAAPGYMGQLTDYSGDTITALKLASQFSDHLCQLVKLYRPQRARRLE